MDALDENRERVIKEMREVQKLSKTAIYALHRGEKVSDKLSRAQSVIDKFVPLIQSHPELRKGTFSCALEEFAEARAFEHFLETGKLLSRSAVPFCDAEEYLGGVADLTGEMIRFAVLKATERDVDAVRR